jgi:hypothetical protein
MRVWDLNSGELIQVLRPPIGQGHEGRIVSVALSPDGRVIAAGEFMPTGGPASTAIRPSSEHDESPSYVFYLFNRDDG